MCCQIVRWEVLGIAVNVFAVNHLLCPCLVVAHFYVLQIMQKDRLSGI